MASKFKRNGIWYIRFKDIDGKWKQKSCGPDTTASNADAIKEKKAKIAVNMRHKMPVFIVDADFLEQTKHYYEVEMARQNRGRRNAISTKKRYMQCINNFIEYAEVLRPKWKSFSEIQLKHIEDFFEYLSDFESAGSIILHRQELNRLFKWAISQNYTVDNPMDETKNPKVIKSTKPPFFYTMDQLEKIFNTAENHYRTIFEMMYLTGMRPGELQNVKYTDILEVKDPKSGAVVRRDLYIPIMVEGCKTKRGRKVPIMDDAHRIITLQRLRAQQIKAPDAQEYIFWNLQGNQLDNANIYRNFKRTIKNCGIKEGCPKTLRHTFASHLAIRGVSLQKIQELMGHASIEETLVYAHLSPESLSEASATLSLPVPKPPLNLGDSKSKLSSAS